MQSAAYIDIDHNNGYFSRYAHLSEIDVITYHSVKAGDFIGESGNTGGSTGPHLHLQIYNGPNMNTVYSTDPFGWNDSSRDPLILKEAVFKLVSIY